MTTTFLADPTAFAGAPCTQDDPDLSFPYDGERAQSYTPRIEAAKRLCQQCPATQRAACLELAMDAEGMAPAESRWGVFGGLEPSERARLARRQNRPSKSRSISTHGTEAGYRHHRRNGEPACEPCRVAAANAQSERRSASRKTATTDRGSTAA